MPQSQITFIKQSSAVVQRQCGGVQRSKRWKSFQAVADLEQPIKDAMATCRRTQSNTVFFVGQNLKEAQQRLANYGDGVFLRWCREEFKLKKTQVYKWIRVADRFGDCPQCVQTIAPSALYLLSEAATPAAARHKAIGIAEKGGTVSRRDAIRFFNEAWNRKSKSPAKQRPTYLEEMKLCWKRMAELYARADENEVRLFDEWRSTDAKAKLTRFPDTFEDGGRVYCSAVAHALRDCRRRREERRRACGG